MEQNLKGDSIAYQFPPISLLNDYAGKTTIDKSQIIEDEQRMVDALNGFNIGVEKIKTTVGPSVSIYEITLMPGVRISKIKNMTAEITLRLSVRGVRIIGPTIDSKTIEIEVPNKNKDIVSMYSVIKSVKFQESDAELPIALGRTIHNTDFEIDLAKMPHILLAGATGYGKSVGLNVIITSLLYKKHPAELKFVLIDPKVVEFKLYTDIENHYLVKRQGEKEAIITDLQKAIITLNSLCVEMDNRHALLKLAEVRDIKEYNEKFKARQLNPNNGHRFMPYFVVIIDELLDLLVPAGKKIEMPISRIAQQAGDVGIHLVIATQCPRVITTEIKNNFPARVAFRMTTGYDSKKIIDQPDAVCLAGKGDMLVSIAGETTRIQGAYIDSCETERVVKFISEQPTFGECEL